MEAGAIMAGATMERLGVRVTWADRRKLRKAGLGLASFIPSFGEDDRDTTATAGEAQRIQDAFDTVLETLGLDEQAGALSPQEADALAGELVAALFGMGPAEGNLPSTGSGGPMPTDPGTASPAES